MPAFPPGPPEGSGVVLLTLATGLELEAEFINGEWWSHINDNPDAFPIDAQYVESWRLLE